LTDVKDLNAKIIDAYSLDNYKYIVNELKVEKISDT
jgi:hypothetical protein